MQNTIYVIGTCHGDAIGFKVEDLYKQLCEIKPDLILDESPIDNKVGIMDWLRSVPITIRNGEVVNPRLF